MSASGSRSGKYTPSHDRILVSKSDVIYTILYERLVCLCSRGNVQLGVAMGT